VAGRIQPEQQKNDLTQYMMGLGQKFLTSAMIFFVSTVRSGWVSHLRVGFEFGKFHIKIKKISFFALQVKKISLGGVKKYPGQRQVGLLFTKGPKYARAKSGPISAVKIIPFVS